jgi:hypothetical protein
MHAAADVRFAPQSTISFTNTVHVSALQLQVADSMAGEWGVPLFRGAALPSSYMQLQYLKPNFLLILNISAN